ncbi:hypothetical protein H310_02930 [Aphanomyces invadans]|uniref:Transmembrane protein n=1 Tax=Aphanomyces invadans TaxID=157072 RepID=A0A024ULP2_9STRA|nr:hypothetical protein H310_02930 [Aphanomyces invadans]ETW06772.1 hypothetical protein H310_02930 [Aphanomyces invadans]|eukprot:XP_008864847.1 hypothetical protein H310_02930 [Aphanomyces invadans]
MVRTVHASLCLAFAALTAARDGHGNNMIGVSRPGDRAGNAFNLVGIPQAGAEPSEFAEAEFDHAFSAMDETAIALPNTPSPEEAAVVGVQYRRPLNDDENARAQETIPLPSSNDEPTITDNVEDDVDYAGDAYDGSGDAEPPAGNATDTTEAPVQVASVALFSESDSSSTSSSPTPVGIVGIALGCVATVCATVVLVRSRRQVALPSSESTLVMDDIRQRESDCGIH